jgi:hypothetical protein
MCEKCDVFDDLIGRYQRWAGSIADQPTLDRIQEVIEELNGYKAETHPGESQKLPHSLCQGAANEDGEQDVSPPRIDGREPWAGGFSILDRFQVLAKLVGVDIVIPVIQKRCPVEFNELLDCR